MNEEIPEEGLPEADSLGQFAIDERFNFSLPHVKPHSEGKVSTGSSTSETVMGAPSEGPEPSPEEPSSEDETDPLIGQTIGNYEVISRLGRGGFGTVYKARDAKLQRFAALKFLRFPLDSEFRRLFEREAQVIANLSKHASIVQIYSWGEHLGSHYFALEYMDASAEGLMDKSGDPLPVKRALEITAECACALHFAHEQGVLHRDVKPANILIDGKTGHAKMCDFGLAKIHTLGGGTDASMIAGSPPYMAPEQIAGKTMDGRTDVYSLGVTLYELLSRQLPCTGSSHVDILEKIRKHKSTPLRKFRPDLSETILAIVQRATAFRPEDRYETAEEMQQAIEAVLGSLERTGSSENMAVLRGSSRIRIAGRRVSVKMAAGALVAAGVLILATAGVLGLFGDSDGGQSSWPVAVAAAKQQIDDGKYEDAIQWLEEYMPAHESDDFAHYALGYARVLTGQIPEAREAFESISDEALREEGLAAVKHADLGDAAREELFAALEAVPSKYPGLLIASLDVVNSKYEAAIDRLVKIDRAAFYFDWQRRQHAELLGQAYYKVENYAMANQALSGAGGATAFGATPSINQMMYVKMARRQLDGERGEALRKQIAHVATLAAAIRTDDTIEEEAGWTSRPLRIRISPTEAVLGGRIAHETGLADFLPDLLADALVENEDLPIEIVDREFISDFLYEQELAELSEGMDRIQQGKLFGARIMITSEFKVFGKEESARIVIIDTESTKSFFVNSAVLTKRDNPREWAQELANEVVAKIKSEYLIRGRLVLGPNGPEIDVGENVGVRDGMKFLVLTGPGAEHRLDVTVTASRVDYGSAKVRLIGFSPDSIHQDGWYVEEIKNP